MQASSHEYTHKLNCLKIIFILVYAHRLMLADDFPIENRSVGLFFHSMACTGYYLAVLVAGTTNWKVQHVHCSWSLVWSVVTVWSWHSSQTVTVSRAMWRDILFGTDNNLRGFGGVLAAVSLGVDGALLHRGELARAARRVL